MIRVRSEHIQEYLAERGIKEEYEALNGNKYYRYTKYLHSLLDKYTVEFVCIPNKL